MEEIYIKYDKIYSVSNIEHVMNHHTNKILSKHIKHNGYYVVGIKGVPKISS